MKQLVTTLFITLILACATIAGAEETSSIKVTVTKAVKHHPQIKSLLYNREAMSQNLASSLGRFFPSLDLTSNAGFQQYSSSTTRDAGSESRHRTASDATVKLSQNLFDGMDRYNTYQGSKERLTSAEYRLFDNVETVALNAIRAHIDVVRQRKLVTLAEENITSHQEVLDSIAERVQAGAGSLADEMQARGRVARAETTLITYTGDLRIAEAEYTRMVGNAPGPLDDAEFTMERVPENMESILDQAMEQNPKIKIFKTELVVVESDKKVAQAKFFPTVDLEVSSRNTNHIDGSDTYLQDNRAMLAMNWNLFSGTSDYHNTKRDSARVKEAEANLQDTIDDMTNQVASTWAEYETTVGSIEKHFEALSYSMESRDMYLMQFNVGQRSLLDVLDSINEVFSNSVQLETAQSNYTFTLYKILALEGVLVNSLEVTATEYDPEAE